MQKELEDTQVSWQERAQQVHCCTESQPLNETSHLASMYNLLTDMVRKM